MRVIFRSRRRVPLFRIVLFILLTLGSAFYYLQNDSVSSRTGVNPASLITLPSPSYEIKLPEVAPESREIVKDIPIQRNQTFSELMQSLGMDSVTIHEISSKAQEIYNLNKIRAGKNMTVTTVAGDFVKLEYQVDPFQTLIVKKSEGVIEPEILTHPSEIKVEELGGEIQGSLYSTIDRLGESDELVIKFADIFEWDVDFFKDLQAGDTFRIIYEKQYVKGEPYGYGKILAAQLINDGKDYTALGYESGKNWEYFSPDGKPMRKAFLASPLKFSRVSSGFTHRRYHPILKKFRPHYGVDYVAPAGTPVRSIGAGRVVLASWAGGAGKTVKIRHNNEITTVYCHLSRYASGIRPGASVSQGQVIGYVGSTGMSTAPHLDFRFIKNGKYVNFLSIKGMQAPPLSASELSRFKASTKEIAAKLMDVPVELRPVEYADAGNRETVPFTEATY